MARPKRNEPADPQAIAAERVKRRAAAAEPRHQARMRGLREIATAEAALDARGLGQEGRWEADLDMLADKELAAGRGVERRTARDGARQKVMSAERADGFTQCWRHGGLDDGQYAAARRLLRDAAQAAGVRTGDTWRTGAKPAARIWGEEVVSRAMMEAGRDLAFVLSRVGIRGKRLLGAHVALVMKGESPPWRAVVTELTGVTETHRQGQVMEDVAEDLRLGYIELDRAKAAQRRGLKGPANDDFAPAARNDP